MDREDLIKILAAHAQIVKPDQPAAYEEAAWEADRLADFIRRFANDDIEMREPTGISGALPAD